MVPERLAGGDDSGLMGKQRILVSAWHAMTCQMLEIAAQLVKLGAVVDVGRHRAPRKPAGCLTTLSRSLSAGAVLFQGGL